MYWNHDTLQSTLFKQGVRLNGVESREWVPLTQHLQKEIII